MPGALPYVPFYVGDYLADTSHLTTLEHGAYLLLLFAYWQRGGPLPNDPKRLRQITLLSPKQFSKMSSLLATFFVDDGEHWVHPRVETELAKARDKSLKAKASAAESARVRQEANAQRTLSERSANAQRTLSSSDPKSLLRERALPSEVGERARSALRAPSAPPAGTANGDGESDERRRAAAQEALFAAVLDVCAIDYNCSPPLWKDVERVVASSHAAGRDAASIRAQAEWFKQNHWRGKRGELPAPKDLLDTAVQFGRGVITGGGGNGLAAAKRRMLDRIKSGPDNS